MGAGGAVSTANTPRERAEGWVLGPGPRMTRVGRSADQNAFGLAGREPPRVCVISALPRIAGETGRRAPRFRVTDAALAAPPHRWVAAAFPSHPARGFDRRRLG
jgi:hypothetical protein